jgi:hypothetical protein
MADIHPIFEEGIKKLEEIELSVPLFGSRLKHRVACMLMASEKLDPMDYMFLSKYRLRKKRMKNKFRNNPQRYLPVWFYGLLAGELVSREIRKEMKQDSFARRIMPPEEIKPLSEREFPCIVEDRTDG